MVAGIRTSTTTDWPPNAGTARSSDRTAPGRMSRFFAADQSPAGIAWCLESPSYRPSGRETVEQNAETVKVVEMGVRYIDSLQVAVVQSDPIREGLGLSHCPHGVH